MKRAIVAVAICFLFCQMISAESKKEEYKDGIKFSLTDEGVKEAIEFGQKTKPKDIDKLYTSYFFGKGFGDFMKAMGGPTPEATVMTKRYLIASYVAGQKVKYLEPDPKQIGQIKNLNSLEVRFLATNTYPEFPKAIHCVLKKDDKAIQPTLIVGKDKPAELVIDKDSHTKTWFGVFVASFDVKDIDPKANYTFVIIDTARDFEQKINLDFSKYQ
jgi:hypothetical protein